MEHHEKINELFNRYLNDECSQEEVHFLLEYFESGVNEVLLKSLIQKELQVFFPIESMQGSELHSRLEKRYDKIRKAINVPRPTVRTKSNVDNPANGGQYVTALIIALTGFAVFAYRKMRKRNWCD